MNSWNPRQIDGKPYFFLLKKYNLVKVFSQFVGCHFVLSFALQKLFSFMRSHLSIVDLSLGHWCCTGNFPLCHCVGGYFSLSLLLDSLYLVVCWGPWSTWIWDLYKEIGWINLHSSTCKSPVEPTPFVENAIFFFPH
jgi:hypothetical protein